MRNATLASQLQGCLPCPFMRVRVPSCTVVAHMLLLASGAFAQDDSTETFPCPAERCPCTGGASQCLEEVGDDLCYCRNVSGDTCTSNISMRLCSWQQQPQQNCTDPACLRCSTLAEAECAVCMDRHLLINGSCLNYSELFLETSIHIKGNLVLMGDSNAYGLLEACFSGTGDCFQAVDFSAQAFLHYFEDVFDGIVVIPWTQLPGTQPLTHYWNGRSQAGGQLAALHAIQNTGYVNDSAANSFVTDLCMRWNTTGLVPLEELSSSPGRWGMTVLDRSGALGGYPPENVRCEDGIFPDCDSDSFIWDFGNASEALDGNLSNFELLLMGLRTATELDELPPLVHCRGPSQTTGFGETTVNCSSTVTLNATEVEESISGDARAEQITPGTSLRMVALTLMPSPEHVNLEASTETWVAGSDLEFLSGWVWNTSEGFGLATDGLADLYFNVSDDQRRSFEENTSDETTTALEEASTAAPYEGGDNSEPIPTTVQVLMTINNVSYEHLSTNASLFNDFSRAVKTTIADTSNVPVTSVSLVLSSGSVRVSADVMADSRETAEGIAQTLVAPETHLDTIIVIAVEDVLEGAKDVSNGNISVSGLLVSTADKKDHNGACRRTRPFGHDLLSCRDTYQRPLVRLLSWAVWFLVVVRMYE